MTTKGMIAGKLPHYPSIHLVMQFSNPFPSTTLPTAQIGKSKFQLTQLGQYDFLISNDGSLENCATYDCVLNLSPEFGSSPNQANWSASSTEIIELKVRTRISKDGDVVNCRYSDLTLTAREKLESWVKNIENPHGGGDSLNQLSYDEIAQGKTSAAPNDVPPETQQPKKRSLTKSVPLIVFCIIIFLMIGIVGSIFVMAKTRNQIKINHGALIGNYLPIQAADDGMIKATYFSEGDHVEAGDILFTIANEEIEDEYQIARDAVAAAKAQVEAFEILIKSQQEKFDFALNNTTQKYLSARAEYLKSVDELKAQQKIVEMIEHLYKQRVNYDIDYLKERRLLSSLEGEIKVKYTYVEKAESEKKAMEEGELVIMGENLDDKICEYRAELLRATAELNTAESLLRMAEKKQDQLNIRATSAGRVFAVYRHTGEIVKRATPILSLSSNGESWAFGSIEHGLAHRVRPGQTVRVKIPALDSEVEGRIAAVGHRSVYTEGGWSQDFKVDHLSVPVKVWLPEMDGVAPTGIRLKMAITLPFRWPWQTPDKYDPESATKNIATL